MSTPIYRFKFDNSGRYKVERWAYANNGQPEYHGEAYKGSVSSDNSWLIEKWTYNGSNQVVLRETSNENVKWDDYLTETYT